MPKEKDNTDVVRLSAIEEDILTGMGSQEFYGLEILAQLNLGRSSQLSFGSLYPALNRLDKKGFISWRWGDVQDGSGGARRKYYKVEKLGERTLDDVQKYRKALRSRALGGTVSLWIRGLMF
jgi:PadR family transcriptional regulator, regulatory protein PadR